MIINETITVIVAVIIAYLLGSISFAYIFTRLFTGKDIRTMGSGNCGANNVYREVGMKVAVPTMIFDVGKGTLAVFIAYRLLEVPLLEPNVYVLLAAVAAIVGHIWSVYLKFKGGNGLSATIGTFAVIIPLQLLIAIGLILVLSAITRNMVLSTNISLLSVPISSWFMEKSWILVGFTISVAVILILNFVPTAMAAMAKAGNKENLTRELLRKDKR